MLRIGVAAFWHIQDIDAGAAVRRLADTAVSITSLGGLAVGPLVAALQSVLPARMVYGVGESERISASCHILSRITPRTSRNYDGT
jgi:hypothetical protein